MKKLLLLIAMLMIIHVNFGQNIVWKVKDKKAIKTLGANFAVQYALLDNIKKTEEDIKEVQIDILVKTVVVQQLRKRVYDSLRVVSSLISDSKDVEYIYHLFDKIVYYQKASIDLVSDDPLLLSFAVDGEKEILQQAKILIIYVGDQVGLGNKQPDKSDPKNLMNGKDRLALLQHIITELESLNKMSYSLYRYLGMVIRAGYIQAAFDYVPDNKEKDKHLKELYEGMIGIQDDIEQ